MTEASFSAFGDVNFLILRVQHVYLLLDFSRQSSVLPDDLLHVRDRVGGGLDAEDGLLGQHHLARVQASGGHQSSTLLLADDLKRSEGSLKMHQEVTNHTKHPILMKVT